MNRRKVSSDQFRDQLIHQLTTLGEEKKQFLDAYFPVYGQKRNEINKLLTTYTLQVKKLLELSDDQLLDTVLIGSRVRVAYLNKPTIDTFIIDHPRLSNLSGDRISFLSPIGSQLLLSSPGDVVTVETPTGVARMRILEIRFASIRMAS